MQKILILKGLPGSGKSTYAKELLKKEPGKWKRVNKDDLRAMLDDGKWSKQNENFVLAVENTTIIDALMAGYNVIVDDTNFNPTHEKRIQGLANALEIKVTMDTKFFDVPLEECIKRDALRGTRSVGAKVIKNMYKKYLCPIPEKISYIPSAPDAIICDIDGTLAIMKGRSPFDWNKVDEDDFKEEIRTILYSFQDLGYKIILLSGRDAICREKTIDWLDCKGIPFDELYMRPQGDTRKDAIVKKEMFNKYIRGKYNVFFVLDDRNQVVDMWRNELGLTCLQVADGDF